MANIEEMIKIPEAKWVAVVITVGAAILIAAKVVDTIYQTQMHDQQKLINKYIIAEYVAKYGDINAGTLQGQIDSATSTLSNDVASISQNVKKAV